jgi:hypothetical protein
VGLEVLHSLLPQEVPAAFTGCIDNLLQRSAPSSCGVRGGKHQKTTVAATAAVPEKNHFVSGHLCSYLNGEFYEELYMRLCNDKVLSSGESGFLTAAVPEKRRRLK